MNQDIQELVSMFSSFDWFHSCGLDSQGRPVVYVKDMSLKILTSVPSKINDKQVLVHFAVSVTANADDFKSNNTLPSLTKPTFVENESSVEESLDYSHLIKELDNLESHCDANTLLDIFFETHDGDNAITNFSSKFPEVRKVMEDLYNTYGFDVIFNELDS